MEGKQARPTTALTTGNKRKLIDAWCNPPFTAKALPEAARLMEVSNSPLLHIPDGFQVTPGNIRSYLSCFLTNPFARYLVNCDRYDDRENGCGRN